MAERSAERALAPLRKYPGPLLAGRLLAAAPLVNEPALQKYVNQVGVYVAQQSSRPQLNWTFGVIASDDINAFAAPGGYIFLTSGLYRMLRSEAELAGILGHEITHVNLRHHVKLLQKTRLRAGYEPFAYIDALDRIGASDRSDQLAPSSRPIPTPPIASTHCSRSSAIVGIPLTALPRNAGSSLPPASSGWLNS